MSAGLYDVYYTDAKGNVTKARYYGHSRDEAKRLWMSERKFGEELIRVEKIKHQER